MAFNTSNPVVVGAATKKEHYDRAFDNGVALKEARHSQDLGGDDERSILTVNTSWEDVPGFVDAELDGTNLGGLTVEVHIMGRVSLGTGRFRLYNLTTAAAVSGSETTFLETTATLKKSGAITLTTGLNTYRLQANISVSGQGAFVWGGKLVIR